MTTETETYWVLRNADCNTYAHYIDSEYGGMTDAWGDVKTAEHFESREDAEECAKDEDMEHLEAVHVVERISVCESVEEYTQSTEERIKAVFRRYFEWDEDADIPNKEYDPDYAAQDALDNLEHGINITDTDIN